MNAPLFTTSWDDGHPLDLRLAELLAEHGFRGTFYVPIRNEKGRAVLAPHDLRELAAWFEIGSHTLDHCYLDSVNRDEARRQVIEGKRRLEDAVNCTVEGFCYPGGKHNAYIRSIVRDAGFAHARTIENFRFTLGEDPFRIPTTLQFYPHSPGVYLRNFVKRGHWWQRFPVFAAALGARNLFAQLAAALDGVCRRAGVFHLWGHSWEVEQLGAWGVLEDFLRYAAGLVPPECRVDNSTLRRCLLA